MIKVEKAVEGLENVTTLRELTETVVGKAVIANFAKIGKLGLLNQLVNLSAITGEGPIGPLHHSQGRISFILAPFA